MHSWSVEPFPVSDWQVLSNGLQRQVAARGLLRAPQVGLRLQAGPVWHATGKRGLTGVPTTSIRF